MVPSLPGFLTARVYVSHAFYPKLQVRRIGAFAEDGIEMPTSEMFCRISLQGFHNGRRGRYGASSSIMPWGPALEGTSPGLSCM